MGVCVVKDGLDVASTPTPHTHTQCALNTDDTIHTNSLTSPRATTVRFVSDPPHIYNTPMNAPKSPVSESLSNPMDRTMSFASATMRHDGNHHHHNQEEDDPSARDRGGQGRDPTVSFSINDVPSPTSILLKSSGSNSTLPDRDSGRQQQLKKQWGSGVAIRRRGSDSEPMLKFVNVDDRGLSEMGSIDDSEEAITRIAALAMELQKKLVHT